MPSTGGFLAADLLEQNYTIKVYLILVTSQVETLVNVGHLPVVCGQVNTFEPVCLQICILQALVSETICDKL